MTVEVYAHDCELLFSYVLPHLLGNYLLSSRKGKLSFVFFIFVNPKSRIFTNSAKRIANVHRINGSIRENVEFE